MDILIKGMEMPKGNTPLVLIINSDGSVDEIDCSDEINATDATAIELPSVGRWIDGQELKAFLKRKMCDVRCAEGKMNCDFCVVGTLFKVIDKSPTLVCEDEGELDG